MPSLSSLALTALSASRLVQAAVLRPRACNFTWAAESGDTCESMAAFWGITEENFIRWNPAVGENCANGVVAGTEYCVDFTDENPPTPTSTSSAPPVATTSAPGSAFPTPIQDGVIKTCTQFHKAVSGDTCIKIVDARGTFSLEDFIKWNPAVGQDCGGLWLGYNYCVAVPGTPTGAPPAPTTTSGSSKPSPTQVGLVENCNRFHKVASGDNCDKISKQYGSFSLADFYKWNPAVGSDCAGLWLGYYVCIGVPGTPTTKPPVSSPTTTTAPAGPSPTQEGIAKNCKQYYKAVSGDYCQKVADANRISLDQFYSWNPAVGRDCSGLWLGYYYCVKV